MSDSDSEIDLDIINGLLKDAQGERDERDRLNNKKNNQSSNQNSINNSNDSNLNNIKFSVTHNNKNETLRTRFSGDNYFRDVAVAIADQITGNEDSIKNNRMNLHWDGKALKMDDKLSSVEGIKGDNGYNLPIFVSFKVVGGGAQMSYDKKKENNNNNNNNKKELRKRIPDFKNEKRIKPTLKPDCIYGWDDKKQLRVKMPCGHVFAPDTLFKLTKMYVNSLTKSKIQCPIIKCKQIWSFDIVVAGADLDENEATKFNEILTKRAMLHSGNFQECKGCKGLIKKPDDLEMIRVRCGNNSCNNRSDICWFCGQNWIGDGFMVCGNKDCGTHRINNLLQTCKMVQPEYLGGHECPEFRHCPRCLTLVGWQSECKHIKCWGCKKEFCFVCLSLKSDDGKWQCGDHTYKCDVHPRQSLK